MAAVTCATRRRWLFATLMLFQMFSVLNARSDEQSAFVHAFRNASLWTALAGSVGLQVVVVYVPFPHNAFGTTSLNVSDWMLCLAVASSVLWLREGRKAVIRWNARAYE
jgi:P-type Ca2+ transporter type 2C